MKSLRRHVLGNSTFFIAVVTFERQPILCNYPGIFWEAWAGRPLDAWAVLPDHFHAVLQLGDESISAVMQKFKIRYYHLYRRRHGPGRVWQNRFWEHVIRDQDDLNRHIDYIHYNPVHHGLVSDPFQYPDSSAKLWLEQGYYQKDWGVKERLSIEGSYGE